MLVASQSDLFQINGLGCATWILYIVTPSYMPPMISVDPIRIVEKGPGGTACSIYPFTTCFLVAFCVRADFWRSGAYSTCFTMRWCVNMKVHSVHLCQLNRLLESYSIQLIVCFEFSFTQCFSNTREVCGTCTGPRFSAADGRGYNGA